jgi:hypothetical protein
VRIQDCIFLCIAIPVIGLDHLDHQRGCIGFENRSGRRLRYSQISDDELGLNKGSSSPTSVAAWGAGPFLVWAKVKRKMNITPEKLAELRVKQLDMLQAAVARMAGVGVSLKNYCITITTAVCGFAITLHRPALALLSLLPITTFALLDAQYLRVERRFRGLFDRVRCEDWGKFPSFEINLKSAPSVPFWGTVFSWSICNFYAPLATAVAIVALIAGYVHGRFV